MFRFRLVILWSVALVFFFYAFIAEDDLPSSGSRSGQNFSQYERNFASLVFNLSCEKFDDASHRLSKMALSESSIMNRTRNCDRYFHDLGLFIDGAEREENDFPMAFAISVHSQIGILELFLAAFFHPKDSYCIHVDRKASRETKQA